MIDYIKENNLPLYLHTDEKGKKEYWSFIELEAIRYDEVEKKWKMTSLNKMWVESQCEVVDG